MIPVLYESTEKQFLNNGLGHLGEAATCFVEEELNGTYELHMQYPIDGKRFSDLIGRRIIYAKPNPYDDPEPFRIYDISQPMLGLVDVYAEHISYDLCGTIVDPFTANNAPDALSKLKTYESVVSDFTYWTDMTGTNADLLITVPTSARSIIGGGTQNILSLYGGELKFEKFAVKLFQNRGYNRGVTIRYGKNLTDVNQEKNFSGIYTGVYPYYYRNEVRVTLAEKILPATGTFDFYRILPLDCSEMYGEDVPTENDLRTTAQQYLDSNDISTPKISIEVSFEQLEKYSEYEMLSIMEQVHLGDTLGIYFEKIGVSGTGKAIKTKYDVMLDKYESVDIGDAKSDLTKSISGLDNSVASIKVSLGDLSKTLVDTESTLRQAIIDATATITGVDGGYITLRMNVENKPYELLIMDTEDISTAVNVWRFNKNGWGHSTTGYNGPFTLAATQDGKINADFVTAGTMSANRISGGTIDANVTNVINLNASEIVTGSLSADFISGGTINGQTVNVTNLTADAIQTGTINGQYVDFSNMGGKFDAAAVGSGQFAEARLSSNGSPVTNFYATNLTGNILRALASLRIQDSLIITDSVVVFGGQTFGWTDILNRTAKFG